MPKYEKVDDHTIRIIIEKADEVPVSRLLENKKSLEAQRDKINGILKNIDEMLDEAKKLGITSKVKELKTVKICSLCKGTKRVVKSPCPLCQVRKSK